MTVPLILLASGAVLLSLIATPAWAWFHHFIEGGPAHFELAAIFEGWGLMLLSILLVGSGVSLGWWFYGRRELKADGTDVLEQKLPRLYQALGQRLYIDEFYDVTVIRLQRILAQLAEILERRVWAGAVTLIADVCRRGSSLSRGIDRSFFNRGFDRGCTSLRSSGGRVARWQNGDIQTYLGWVGSGVVLLLIFFAWL